jgi:hypothetical protein
MKTYSELITEDNKKYYSINFLLAEFNKLESQERDMLILNNRIECEYFETKDFKVRSYYKKISKCIKNFE